jgi:arylsulfatase A-like enzyme
MPGHSLNISTPNLDNFYYSGVRFTSTYAGQAVCAPSRNTLLTAQHTGHSLIRGNYMVDGHDLPLRPTDFTLAELLQQNEYNTHLVGKWGLGWYNTTGAPWNKGFDTYYGQLDQNYCHNMFPYGSMPNGDELGVWFYENGNLQHLLFPNNANASREFCMQQIDGAYPCTYTHDLFTARALDIIQEQSNAGLSAPPFFTMLAYTDPHAGGFKEAWETGQPVPSDDGPFIFSNQTWPNVEKDHASVISNFMDVDIAKIISLLDETGLRQNTLVIHVSDNGPHNEGGHNVKFFDSAGPLRGFKRSLYEGGIRVPAAVSMPGVIPSGVVVDSPFAFWDIMPTIADMLQISLPSNLSIDGESVWELWQGKAPSAQHKPFYFEFCTNNEFGRAVRDGNYKIVNFAWGDAFELYDLSVDLGETNNIAAQHPDIVARLVAIANASHVDNPYFPIIDCTSS